MATRIQYIVLSLALFGPAFLSTTAVAQHRRDTATASDTQTRKDNDSKRTDDKAVKRQQKEAEKREKQAAKRRADEDKKRQEAERKNRDGRKGDDRAVRRDDDRRDPTIWRPPFVAERTRVVFVGGYFYDPIFGPYPWWLPAVYRHPVIDFEGRAQVRLQVTPRAAAVYVDGFYAGIVDDFDGFFERLPLLSGGHTIALYLQGFGTISRSIYLAPGSELRIREDLLPLPPGMASEPPSMSAMLPSPPAGSYLPPHTAPLGQPRPPIQQAGNQAEGFGVLSLRFRPPDAVVTIDGQEWLSSAPGELVIHLGVGVHVITLKAPGYQSFSRDVEIRDGETAEVNVSAPRQTT